MSWHRFQLKENFLSCSVGNGNGHCSGSHSKGLRGSDDFFSSNDGSSDALHSTLHHEMGSWSGSIQWQYSEL